MDFLAPFKRISVRFSNGLDPPAGLRGCPKKPRSCRLFRLHPPGSAQKRSCTFLGKKKKRKRFSTYGEIFCLHMWRLPHLHATCLHEIFFSARICWFHVRRCPPATVHLNFSLSGALFTARPLEHRRAEKDLSSLRAWFFEGRNAILPQQVTATQTKSLSSYTHLAEHVGPSHPNLQTQTRCSESDTNGQQHPCVPTQAKGVLHLALPSRPWIFLPRSIPTTLITNMGISLYLCVPWQPSPAVHSLHPAPAQLAFTV